ncbi:MAG: YggS family pyridoxal phosphate-dependent enzyme [Actinomycetota bacterium]|nr:YggS family pyridoxal phosphate-dependent enzyme [Actinomycetota bacterium]
MKEKYSSESKDKAKLIKENVQDVFCRIKGAAARVGRDPSSVRLLAATKNRNAKEVKAAYEAGIRLVGENRVQEMTSKMQEVEVPLEWHFIGHLQRNKVKQVVGRVALIHSIDSLRLAEEISDRAGVLEIKQPVLVQVNVSSEESKYGIDPSDAAEFFSSLQRLDNLEVLGLSTIAPLAKDSEEVRWVFRELRELEIDLRKSFPKFTLDELSMGMTSDFEVAVEEGSTLVRIGTAIFGPANVSGS